MLMIEELSLTTGVDIPIPELQIVIHQPTIKEIALIGEEKFFSYLSYFNINNSILINYINKDDFILEEIYEAYIEALQKLSNLETIMFLIKNNELIKEDIIDGITTILNLIIPNYNFQFDLEDEVIIGYGQNILIINSQRFNIIREIIEIIFDLKNIQGNSKEEFNPADEKAKEIMEKIKAGRKKIAQQYKEETGSFLSKYVMILMIGLKYDINQILNLTLYQMIKLVKKYTDKLQYDTQLQISVASMQSLNNLQHWIM